MRSTRHGLRVDIFAYLRKLSIAHGDGENEMVVKRLVRCNNFALGEANNYNLIALSHIFTWFWISKRNLLTHFLECMRHFGRSTICSG